MSPGVRPVAGTVISFPKRGVYRALAEIDRITELASDTEVLLSLSENDNLDLSGLLDLLEQSSKSLGEIGAILLKEQDREQMEAVLSSLDGLIKQTRERVRKLRGLTCPDN